MVLEWSIWNFDIRSDKFSVTGQYNDGTETTAQIINLEGGGGGGGRGRSEIGARVGGGDYI